jgi:DNA-binding transcriptional ArsR family regulator
MNVSSASDPFTIFSFYMGHPLRMQIYFYLSMFKELSLNEICNYLDKSKTTVHHHTKDLEEKAYINVRTQITKNYTESYYSLPQELTQFLEKDINFEKKILEGTITAQQISVIFQSFSSFIFALLQRFSVYLEQQPQRIPTDFPLSLIEMLIIDEKTYQKGIKSIRDLFQKMARSNQSKSQTDKAFIVGAVSVPFSRLFEKSEKI